MLFDFDLDATVRFQRLQSTDMTNMKLIALFAISAVGILASAELAVEDTIPEASDITDSRGLSDLISSTQDSASDDDTKQKVPLVKPTALLDQSLSRVVPGAKRGSPAEKHHSAGLEIELSAIKTHVDLTKDDDALELAFTAFNPTDADITICTRDTPLAGEAGKLLADLFVVQNGAAMIAPYRGKDMKMTEQPGPEEYLTIPAGEAVVDIISLKAYQLGADGTYYIRVKQPHDEHIIYTDVMRTQVVVEITGVKEFEARYAERETVRGTEGEQVLAQTAAGAVSYNGCSSSEQATLAQWHEDALHKIASARACTESSCQAQVDAWFGASTTQSQFVAGATAQFNTMASVQGNTIYRCESGTSSMRQNCGGSTFAYVYPTDTQQNIYVSFYLHT